MKSEDDFENNVRHARLSWEKDFGDPGDPYGAFMRRKKAGNKTNSDPAWEAKKAAMKGVTDPRWLRFWDIVVKSFLVLAVIGFTMINPFLLVMGLVFLYGGPQRPLFRGKW